MSKGLFHRAILESGSSIATWARQRDPLGVARTLAKALGHNVQEPDDLYKLFMNTTLPDLVSTQLPLKKGGQFYMSNLPYVPCTERPIEGVEPFITDTPFNILTRGEYNKLPVIIGANDEEGYMFAALENEESISKMSFEAVLELLDLDFPSEKERRKAAQHLRKLYLGDDEISAKNILQLSKFYGEPYFNLPTTIETDLLVKTSGQSVYSYLFQYNGWRNFPKFIIGPKFWKAPGATHADELYYLFNLFPMPTFFESRMIETMTTLWTNFAKYGTPTPEGSELQWPPSTISAQNRLEITAEPYITPVIQHPLTLQYWLYLYDKYRAA